MVRREPRKGNGDPSSGEGSWLNRNVILFGLTSFFSDFCHEMATAVLPGFLQIIGASAASVGFIEGAADGQGRRCLIFLLAMNTRGAGHSSSRVERTDDPETCEAPG